jgi:hypothetical protein
MSELDKMKKRVDKLKPGAAYGDVKQLSKVLDVCMFTEPELACFNISSTEATRVVVACLNYGYYAAAVGYEISTQKQAISLDGQLQGIFFVDRPAPREDYYINWQQCFAKARAPQTRDDCVCNWSVDENDKIYRTFTQLRMRTA